MRKFIILLSAFILVSLSGCKISQPVTWFQNGVYSVDYFKAGLNGKVFITESNSVNFEYDPVGSITVEQKSGYLDSGKSEKVQILGEKGDPIYGNSDKMETKTKRKKGEWKSATYESVLEEASRAALEMGGDAIINLKLERAIDYVANSPVGSHPYITGMVVKRKK